MKFLQILSTNAWQNITYHCQNSFAWANYENERSNYLKMLGDNDLEYHALSARKFRPEVVQDECKVRSDFISRTAYCLLLPIAGTLCVYSRRVTIPHILY